MRIISNLKLGLLIGIDILRAEEVSINLQTQLIVFLNCKYTRVLITFTLKTPLKKTLKI